MELTERLIAANAAASFHLETRGQTTIERVISLVLLGDLVSDLPGGAARRGPRAGTCDRRAQGCPRRELSGDQAV